MRRRCRRAFEWCALCLRTERAYSIMIRARPWTQEAAHHASSHDIHRCDRDQAFLSSRCHCAENMHVARLPAFTPALAR